MAATFLRDYSPLLEVVSAGRNPFGAIDPMAALVMRECLSDLSDYRPKKASDFDSSDFDVVYECPEPPCSNTVEAYRELRDYIKNEAYLFFRHL
jgi:protein-tyrosine-phosphatase